MEGVEQLLPSAFGGALLFHYSETQRFTAPGVMFPKKCLLECSGLSGNQDPALNLASGSLAVQRPEEETEVRQSFSVYRRLPRLSAQVQQEAPAKKSRLDCDADDDLITSTTPNANTPRKAISRVGRRGSINGRERAAGYWCRFPVCGFI